MAPDQPSFTQIGYGVADAVATITLQRPDKLNAFTHVMAGELVAACDLADGDDEVRAVVVTGSGRAFCAGADLDPKAAEFSQEPMRICCSTTACHATPAAWSRCGSPRCSNR